MRILIKLGYILGIVNHTFLETEYCTLPNAEFSR